MANDNTGAIPQIWSNELLMTLEDSVVMAALVHRDFDDEIAQFGNIVNANRVRKYRASRKGGLTTDAYVDQDAVLDMVQVPLNQWAYTSFMLSDDESSKSIFDLIGTHVVPAAQALARDMDRIILGQAHRFLLTHLLRVGQLGKLTAANARAQLVEAREKLKVRNVPDGNLSVVLSPSSESQLLNTDLFVKVNESGSSSALREAVLGRLFNFTLYCAKNVPQASDTVTDFTSGTVTNAIVANTGPASQAVSIIGYEAQVGDWIVIDGNDQPQWVTAATVGAGDTTAITPNESNKFSTLAGAAIKIYESVDAQGAFPINHPNEILVDGWDATKPPAVGQFIAVGTGASRRTYTIVESFVNPLVATEQYLLLDRPLEIAIANNQKLFPGPAGSFNLAFHRDALALVNRPLILPPQSHGVQSSVVRGDSLSLRIKMQYDNRVGATHVVIDSLLGVALLDADLATLWLG